VVPILPGDDEDALAARVLVQEHRIYPQAVRWFAEDRLSIEANGRVTLKGESGTVSGCVIPALDEEEEGR